LRPSFARPFATDGPTEQTDKARTAAVFTPYALTPGGGERYLLTLAALLARHSVVTVVTPHPYSLLRLRNLGQEFGVDLSHLRYSTEAAFAEAPSPDLMVTMGNHVIPPVPARGKANIFLCQFPFRMSELPKPIDRALFANYDAVVVYSRYTAAHFYAALNALQLPQIALRIVNPPVQLITGDCAKKQRTILSVGRFFVGGHSKRHDALISSFKTICDQFEEPVELHLAGSSTPAPEHMDYLASLKASSEGYPIHFHVNCSASELHSLYRDAFVYWHGAGIDANLSAEPEKAEHFGISIVEAMSAQAIPFALNSGGPREIIDDGETGFLYDSVETMMGLTLGIFSKAERPRAERIMRAAGLRAYHFSTENFERAIEALFKELT
jgi:glycosyltransferase involved in cell wall biosynthesis